MVTSWAAGNLHSNHPHTVFRHALSDLVIRATPVAPQLCPARPQRSLPGFQAVQPPANGRWLGRNRGDSSQLVAPAIAAQRACQPAQTTCARATSVDHLTRHLIKVIKHVHFPAFLRYNLPPIIRTSPDRASRHRHCACIDTLNRPQRAAHTDRVKLARLLFSWQNPHLFANLQSCHYARSLSLFARFCRS